MELHMKDKKFYLHNHYKEINNEHIYLKTEYNQGKSRLDMIINMFPPREFCLKMDIKKYHYTKYNFLNSFHKSSK
jgi:hypothetical protein